MGATKVGVALALMLLCYFVLFPRVDAMLGISTSYSSFEFYHNVEKPINEMIEDGVFYCTMNGEPIPCDIIPDLSHTYSQEELEQKIEDYNRESVKDILGVQYNASALNEIWVGDPIGVITGAVETITGVNVGFSNPWQMFLLIWFSLIIIVGVIFVASLVPLIGIGGGA